MDAESIKIMAETISIGNLPEEAAREIAEEVTYRVRQLTQDAAKLMHHGKRAKLTCDDIDQALIDVQTSDIAVTKTVDKPNANITENVTFTITATNTGPNIATDLQLQHCRSRSE